MLICKRICTLALGLLVFGNGQLVNATEHPIRFGSVAMDIPAVMHRRLTPLTQYLSHELGKPVELRLSKDMQDAIKAVANDQVELAYLTPVAYLKSHAMGQTRLVAKTITDGKGSFKLMIVVRANSPIKTIADLKGKKFAFGDPAALLQRAVVVGSGIDLASLGSYNFLGHYDNIVRAVMHGEYDAGILKDTMAYKWRNKGIRILYESEDLPPYNIAASKNVNDKMLAKLKQAFLKLDPKNPEHMQIIKALDKNYDGFAATTDHEYDVVRKLIAPFSK